MTDDEHQSQNWFPPGDPHYEAWARSQAALHNGVYGDVEAWNAERAELVAAFHALEDADDDGRTGIAGRQKAKRRATGVARRSQRESRRFSSCRLPGREKLPRREPAAERPWTWLCENARFPRSFAASDEYAR